MTPALPADPTAVRLLRKAERHVHLEGTLGRRAWGLLRGQASHPADPRFLEGTFSSFLDHYRSILDLLKDPQDYGRLARLYLDEAPEHGVVHVEFSVSLLSALRRGHDVRRLLESIQQASEDQRGDVGVSVVVDTVRQFGVCEAMRTLEAAIPHRDLGVLRGFGMGGDELAVPAAEFGEVFRRARDEGFRTTVHTGEVGGPGMIREVLDHLRPDRIGHGIRAAEDPTLLALLAKEGMPLDVCPTSNLKTGAVRDPERHPLRKLLDAGIRVTLGTDDPGMFETDLTREYMLAARMASLDAEELEAIARESLTGL